MVASLLFYLVGRPLGLPRRRAVAQVDRLLLRGGHGAHRALPLSRGHGRRRSSRGATPRPSWAPTVLVMLVAPWEDHSAPASERLANLLIIGAVWRFATGSDPGAEPGGGPAPRARGTVSTAWSVCGWRPGSGSARRRPACPGCCIAERPRPRAAEPLGRRGASGRHRPARLCPGGADSPQGRAPDGRAGAGRGRRLPLRDRSRPRRRARPWKRCRRAERAGAQVAAGVVPRRLALAGALLLVVLIASLAMPGVHFQGSGRLRPPTAQGEGEEKDSGDPTSDKIEKLGQRPPQEQGRRREPGPPAEPPWREPVLQGRRGPRRCGGRHAQPSGTAGEWLIVPLVLALILGGLWALLRLWPHLGGWWGRLTGRLRELLARLAGFFVRPPRKAKEGAEADPLADLEDLSLLPPREAVLAAYQRFLALLNVLGHPRPRANHPLRAAPGSSAAPAPSRRLRTEPDGPLRPRPPTPRSPWSLEPGAGDLVATRDEGVARGGVEAGYGPRRSFPVGTTKIILPG